MAAPLYGVVLPACDEAEALPVVLAELRAVLPAERFVICVGVNNSRDGTADVARALGFEAAETAARGYGHGCQVAVEHLRARYPALAAFLFAAADGAANPADLLRLVEVYETGFAMVLGCRTTRAENQPVLGLSRVVANRLLGAWCGVLTGHFFRDLGPLRIIEAGLFQKLGQCEWTYGWTIEGQIAAVRAGARVCEIEVDERPRVRGEQKVTGVSWRQTLRIGWHIFQAGWRVRRRWSSR